MDPEEAEEKADKQKEIRKSINILIKTINDKPNNTEAIKDILDSIKSTFKPDAILEISRGLYDTDDSKITNKENLAYALRNLQSAHSSKLKKLRNEEESDEEEISGGKRKKSTKKRRSKKRTQKKRKRSKRRRTKRRRI
jgi:hypothetical protein